MSAIDMLVKNVMQSAGIDPEKVKAEIQEYGRQLAAKVESMDRQLTELKLQQTLMYELLVNLSLKGRKAGEAGELGTAAIAAAPNGEKPHA